MASFAIFACLVTHAVVCSLALTIGDDETVILDATSAMPAGGDHEMGETQCQADTGETCRFLACNSGRGRVHCTGCASGFPCMGKADYLCKCDTGYCGGGSFYDSKGVYVDKGMLCLETCGAYLKNNQCQDAEEVTREDDHLCADKACKKAECCLPKGVCSGKQCDAETEVLVKNATLCTGTDCQPVECCLPRGVCSQFECPANTELKNSSAAELCKGEQCFANECCQTSRVPMLEPENQTAEGNPDSPSDTNQTAEGSGKQQAAATPAEGSGEQQAAATAAEGSGEQQAAATAAEGEPAAAVTSRKPAGGKPAVAAAGHSRKQRPQ